MLFKFNCFLKSDIFVKKISDFFIIVLKTFVYYGYKNHKNKLGARQ